MNRPTFWKFLSRREKFYWLLARYLCVYGPAIRAADKIDKIECVHDDDGECDCVNVLRAALAEKLPTIPGKKQPTYCHPDFGCGCGNSG